ncbi:hypothetical protein B9J78_03455 [bacterium Unc6]|nr:hypothetical protein [bacterium Unc6]
MANKEIKIIGEFYKVKVLTLPKKSLVKRELPNNSGEIKIDRDLFGWKLYSGKDFIECRSEEEARYLKVFLDAGLREIRIPKDDEYLKNILPELEKLKARTDKIINSYLETVLDRKIRARVRHEVYMEITK